MCLALLRVCEGRSGDVRMVRVREIVQQEIILTCLSFVITGVPGGIRACGVNIFI